MDFLELCQLYDDVNNNDTEIYRYYSYCKLKKMFEDKAIYLCNAEKFKDKRERQLPQSYYDMVENMTSNSQMKNKKKIDDSNRDYIKSYVTCWTTESDNYAFWKIYTPNADGVMVKTTVGKLKELFYSKKVAVTGVSYIKESDDNNGVAHIIFTENTIPNSISLAEKYKIYPYNYEKEIRFVLYSKENTCGSNYNFDSLDFIDEFMISPFANESMTNVIRALIQQYLPSAIIKSSEIKESE